MEELFYQYWPYVAVFFAYPVLKKVNKHIVKPICKRLWTDLCWQIVEAGGDNIRSNIKALENSRDHFKHELEEFQTTYEKNLKPGDTYKFGFDTFITITEIGKEGYMGTILKDGRKVFLRLRRVHGCSNDGIQYVDKKEGVK